MIESPVALVLVPGINRNIVECKVPSNSSFKVRERVLIETLWNVKNYVSDWNFNDALVLIETLWNVKYFCHTGQKAYGYGINRNIVECKDVCRVQSLRKFMY